MGDKGSRGNRGKQGKKSICESCNGGDLCVQKILGHITLTYNWWRQIKGLKKYPHSYTIKNEYLISKVLRQCKSNEFNEILNKYGSNTIPKKCENIVENKKRGAYDYIFKMWSIWILIILKYSNGSLFLESSHLNETDFYNLIIETDNDEDNEYDNDITDTSTFWNNMFISENNDMGENILLENSIVTKQSTDNSDNKLINWEINNKNNKINSIFFNNYGIPTELYHQKSTPFDEIKKYDAWYWGSDPNSKPKINLISNNLDDLDSINNEKLHKSCINYNKSEPKIKIKITNNYYKLFSTDYSANNKTASGISTPFSKFGTPIKPTNLNCELITTNTLQTDVSDDSDETEKTGVTFMRPYDFTDYKDHFNFRNYRPVGDVVFYSDEVKEFLKEPNKCFPNDLEFTETFSKRFVDGYKFSTILVSGDNMSVKSPDAYDCVYSSINRSGINKNITAFNVFKPIISSPYKALGYVITTTPYSDINGDLTKVPKPSSDLIWCVHENCLNEINDIGSNVYSPNKIWENNSKNLEGSDDTKISITKLFTVCNITETIILDQQKLKKKLDTNSEFAYNINYNHQTALKPNIDSKNKDNELMLYLNLFKMDNDTNFYSIINDSVCQKYDPKNHKYSNNNNSVNVVTKPVDLNNKFKYSILKLYEN